MEFTDEQLELINQDGSVYVEACPGAGKTQTIVERFAVRPNKHPRKGVALLSFTNAASEEARKRCGGDPDLTSSPNFIGTIDQFINRFIIGPVLNAEAKGPIRYVPSWDHLPNTAVHLGTIREVQLGWFDYAAGDGSAVLNLSHAPFRDRLKLEDISTAQRTSLQDLAKVRRAQLLQSGYYSAEAVRLKTSELLKSPEAQSQVIRTLQSRFCEIIVDEVQDCSDEDFGILKLIKHAGINLVLVGDPDQAIYGFRQLIPADPTVLSALVPQGSRLSGNFRSTPAICKLADGLREAKAINDHAVGRFRHSDDPVLVFGFRSYPKVYECLELIRKQFGYSKVDSVVLAHGASTARAAAGNRKTELKTQRKLVRIAYLIETLELSKDAAVRTRAIRTLSNLIHESASDKLSKLEQSAFFDEVGYDEREFRTRLLRICAASRLDRGLPPSDFKAKFIAAAHKNGFTWLKGRSIAAPAQWPTLPVQSESAFNYGTVHSFKGLQKPFVSVVVPKESNSDRESATDLWRSDAVGEARRVLYVGATRAEKTLLLAIEESQLEGALECLERDGVPIRFIRVEDGKIVDRF